MPHIIRSPDFWNAFKATIKPSTLRDMVSLIPEQLAAQRCQWNEIALEQKQSQKLQRLIQHALANSPYYRELAQRHNILPQNIRTMRDLSPFPTLRSSDIKDFQDQILVPNIMYETGLKAYVTTSSGTSGEPKRVFHMENADYIPTAATFTRSFNAWNMAMGKVIM